MKLLTKEIEKRFLKYPLYSQDGKGFDARVIAYFFSPSCFGTWLITEASKNEQGDWIMFGYCQGFQGQWEWGYVSLNELSSVRTKPLGLPIEREMYYNGKSTVAEILREKGVRR